MQGLAAGQGAGQDFAHQGHAVTLVLAERQDRPQLAGGIGFEHHMRVGGRIAAAVDQGAGRHFLLRLHRHPHLAQRHPAGGEIQNHRRLVGARNAATKRVGGEARVGPAERRHQRAQQGIDEVQRHQTGGGAILGPLADAPDVVAVAQRDQRQAAGRRALNADFHRLMADHLAIALAAIDHQHRTELGADLRMLIRPQTAGADELDILWNHADTVRVVARQVGQHQVARHQLGFTRRTAGTAYDALDKFRQVRRRDDDVGGAHWACSKITMAGL